VEEEEEGEEEEVEDEDGEMFGKEEDNGKDNDENNEEEEEEEEEEDSASQLNASSCACSSLKRCNSFFSFSNNRQCSCTCFHSRTVVAVGLTCDSVVKSALTSSTTILLKCPFFIGNNFGSFLIIFLTSIPKLSP